MMVGETTATCERRFAVEAVAPGLGVARDAMEVAHELSAAFLSELGYALPVGAGTPPVQVRQTDQAAVPAQEFQEPRIADVARCGAGELVGREVVRVAHASPVAARAWAISALARSRAASIA